MYLAGEANIIAVNGTFVIELVAFIAMIACRMGMSVERDARSVGENTTSTVVQSIVWVIVLDAIFAVTLQKLDL